jgi:ABC-type transport system involved in cytochrome c biogenesis permease subunit
VEPGLDLELRLLWTAVVVYVAAGSVAVVGLLLRRRADTLMLSLMVAALALHGLSIGLRWSRLEHGPFITLFEILSSNVWSLAFLFTLACWHMRALRPTAAVVLPVLFVLMGWLVLVHPGDGHFPPTYDTVWLYIHIGLGKVFLGAVIIALGLAGVILLRAGGLESVFVDRLPDDDSLDELAYRFMAVGLVFDSLMLVAGAIWAQDAWGRYWAWDPLETWAFVTWLMLAFALHLRAAFPPSPVRGAALVAVVFVVAFLTFFGVPFVSQAPHKGVV